MANRSKHRQNVGKPSFRKLTTEIPVEVTLWTALSNFVRVRYEFFGQFRRLVRTKIRPSSIIYRLAEAARLRRASTAPALCRRNPTKANPQQRVFINLVANYVFNRSLVHCTARVFTLLSKLRNGQIGYWSPTVLPPSRFPSPRNQRFPLYSL